MATLLSPQALVEAAKKNAAAVKSLKSQNPVLPPSTLPPAVPETIQYAQGQKP